MKDDLYDEANVLSLKDSFDIFEVKVRYDPDILPDGTRDLQIAVPAFVKALPKPHILSARYLKRAESMFDDLEQEVPLEEEPAAPPSPRIVSYWWNNDFSTLKGDHKDINAARYLDASTHRFDHLISSFEVQASWASANLHNNFEVIDLRV